MALAIHPGQRDAELLRARCRGAGDRPVLDDQEPGRRNADVGDGRRKRWSEVEVLRRPVRLEPGALNDVSLTLYKLGGGATAPVQDVSVSDLTQVNTTTAAPEDWPATLDEDAAADSSVCAVLGESSSSGMARTTLASADQIESGGVKVTGGTGALVRASAGGGIGPVFLITDAGRARGLSGTLSDTLARLGYEEGSVVAVPAAWLALFPTGVELSTEAVWDGVSETGQPTPEPTPEPTPRSRLTTTRSRAARRGGRRSSPRPPRSSPRSGWNGRGRSPGAAT